VCQRLGDAVDLIVGLAVRERQQFGFELGQERCALRKQSGRRESA
jgi:hypothetical protein